MKTGTKIALGIGGLVLVGATVWLITRKKEGKCPSGYVDGYGNCTEAPTEEDVKPIISDNNNVRPNVTLDDLLNLPSVKNLGITRKDVEAAYPKPKPEDYDWTQDPYYYI